MSLLGVKRTLLFAYDPKRTSLRYDNRWPKGQLLSKEPRSKFLCSFPFASPMEFLMNITRRTATIGGFSLLAGSHFGASALADVGDGLRIGEGLEEFWLATDAYIYGYPLVTVEMTRRVITNVTRPEGTRGPMGYLIKLREYPTPAFKDVTAPNADTLYTSAFFDVGNEPWVLSIPDMKDRYALFPMLDGWTTVFQVPGKRTTGTAAQTYAITGPGWKGTL